MSNDDRVKELNKKIDVALKYSDKLEHKHVVKPNKEKLKQLATKIRKNLEDTSVEITAHSHTGA